MVNMRTWVGMFLVLILPLSLSGCWDATETNELAMVTTVGIDKGKRQPILLSLQFLVPQQGTGQSNGGSQSQGQEQSGGTMQVISAEGETIADAMSALQFQLPRRIFWGQTEAIILGDKISKKALQEVLDFFIRHADFRQNIQLSITDGEANQLLTIPLSSEQSLSSALMKMNKLNVGLNITLRDFYRSLKGHSQAAVLPRINIQENTKLPYINGIAVFKKDEMLGKVNLQQSMGVFWLMDQSQRAVLTFSPEKGKGKISLEVLRFRRELLPKIENGKWVMDVNIEIVDDLIQNASNLNVMDPAITQEMEKDAGNYVKKQINDSLHLVKQQFKADIFGFSNTFYQKYPQQWDQVKPQWDKIYSEMEVRLNVKVHIKRPDMLSR